jgi:hypothetical protein
VQLQQQRERNREILFASLGLAWLVGERKGVKLETERLPRAGGQPQQPNSIL